MKISGTSTLDDYFGFHRLFFSIDQVLSVLPLASSCSTLGWTFSCNPKFSTFRRYLFVSDFWTPSLSVDASIAFCVCSVRPVFLILLASEISFDSLFSCYWRRRPFQNRTWIWSDFSLKKSNWRAGATRDSPQIVCRLRTERFSSTPSALRC